MPTDDRDDPGADTAMFRAYVEQPTTAESAGPAQNRTLIIGLVVAIVVLAVLAIALVAA